MTYAVALDTPLMPVSASSIIAAKEMAVEQYLTPKSAGTRFRAHGISPNPRDNVRGVGIGLAPAGTRAGPEPCIRLYVEHKIPSSTLPSDLALPPEIGGFPTEVIESGRFISYQGMPYRERLRPAQPGPKYSSRAILTIASQKRSHVSAILWN
jgi:hypothetical protein